MKRTLIFLSLTLAGGFSIASFALGGLPPYALVQQQDTRAQQTLADPPQTAQSAQKKETEPADKCYSCHIDIDDKVAKEYKKDIHYQKGISCAGCHGGNSTVEDQDAGMAKSAGYIGIPSKPAIPALCAKCHSNAAYMRKYDPLEKTNQYADFKESIHGKALESHPNDGPECVSCHGIHAISEVSSPSSSVYPTNVPKTCGKCHNSAEYMKEFDPELPIGQLTDYSESVHGKRNGAGDTRVAECANCHGSHGILDVKNPKSPVYPLNLPNTCGACHSNKAYMAPYNIPTDIVDQYKHSVHGIALLEKGDMSAPVCNTCHKNHAAAPKGIDYPNDACAKCHASNGQLFAESPHAKPFAEQHIGKCTVCHNLHDIQPPTDSMIGTTPNTVCVKCHSEQESPKAMGVAAALRAGLDSLVQAKKDATFALNRAEQKGMDVEDARFNLKNLDQHLIQAQTLAHTVSLANFQTEIGKGMNIAHTAREAGDAAYQNYFYRRRGLGIATLFISLLAVILYLKIRSIERNP